MEIIFPMKNSLSHIVKDFSLSLAPINTFGPIYVLWAGASPHHVGYNVFGAKISDIRVEYFPINFRCFKSVKKIRSKV